MAKIQLAENDDVVKAIPPNRVDQFFGIDCVRVQQKMPCLGHAFFGFSQLIDNHVKQQIDTLHLVNFTVYHVIDG